MEQTMWMLIVTLTTGTVYAPNLTEAECEVAAEVAIETLRLHGEHAYEIECTFQIGEIA